MQFVPADERDSAWEQHESTFRVYLVDENGATTTFDVTDATFSEVHAWTLESAGGTRVATALVGIALVGVDACGFRGLTWLLGMDPNDVPETELQRRMVAETRVPPA